MPARLLVMLAALMLCAPPAPAQTPGWRLVAELRVGNESAREYALTESHQLAVAADGTMYLAQPQDRTIRVFRADGRFVRFIGRDGEGPGEFTGLEAIGLRGDTLWASDPDRIHLFTRDGALIRTVSLRYDAGRPDLGPRGGGYLLRDGSLAATPVFSPTLDVRTWPSGVPVLRVAPDGVVRDTLGSFDLGFLTLYTWQGEPRMRMRPFQPQFLHAVDPAGGFLEFVSQDPARRDEFTFTRVTIDGDTTVHRAISYQPVSVSRAVRDSIAQAMSQAGGVARPRGQVDAMLRAAPIPEHYPPVSAMTVSTDGTTWLRLQGRSTGPWLVLDASGTRKAVVDGPLNLRILAASATHVWGIEHDDADVPGLVRYRIDRAGSN